ncbi:biliverdin reductase A [Aplysia californica]|uniref:Biliverdin reductase A n=1 Tax=Aplysia californica TaxID=6500 RepID=A0ABM0ZZI9_APLCA|nr:biliverdin reductase A [Aplysia californica]XP_012937752.1 biliverdin reductase A [Aplysia californica]XP_012937753.1 biliverdin reductase A [Aplysia californica]
MSPPAQEIGVVVVGLGMAGKFRARDLRKENCALRLRGVVSRRPIEMEGIRSYTLEEALSDKDVQAVIISTEPAWHEEYSRRALESGKHVLVEYPVALTSDKARELYNIAEQKGLVLHEENVALLTEKFLAVKKKAAVSPIKSVTFSLKGVKNTWLGNFEQSGLPFVCGVSGIQVLISLFGNLAVTGGSLDSQDDGFAAVANMETAGGGSVSYTLTRFVNMKREKHEVYTFEDGEVLDTDTIATDPNKTGLFEQDMLLFNGEIQDGKIPEDRKNLSIYGLEVAEKIHSYF